METLMIKSPERLKVEGVGAMPDGRGKSLSIDLLVCEGVEAHVRVRRRASQNGGLRGCHDGKNDQHGEFHLKV